MKVFLGFSALAIFLLLCSSTLAQHPVNNWPKPPQPMGGGIGGAKSSKSTSPFRVDPIELQREARELSDLASSLPADMDHIGQGLMPKDTIDKLKRIEKLSKQLRGQIGR